MERPTLPKRIVYQPTLGAIASFSRTLTEADVALFIGVTWDINPLHTDDVYMSGTPFKRRIVPGLLTASMLTHMGGLWAFLASEFHLEFVAPVYIGETVTATSEIVEVNEGRNYVRMVCQCTTQDGRLVLRGEVAGYPGKFEA